MEFDKFYETVGVFGPYQKVKYFLLCCTNMLPPVMVYAWTFIAATPSFRCQSSSDQFSFSNLTDSVSRGSIPSASQCRLSQKGISLRECQRCFQVVNTSYSDSLPEQFVPCQSFLFDRTYYQSTLVEEVSDATEIDDRFIALLVLVVNGLRSSFLEKYRPDRFLSWLHGRFVGLRCALG